MKMKTTELTALVSKASAGASNSAMLALTSLMLIRLENNTLTLETTDMINYLYVATTVDCTDTLYAVVNADLFVKLINKCTSEYTELTIKDGTLVVHSNGTYIIPMQLDEDGNVLKYTDPLNNTPLSVECDEVLTVSDIINARNNCSASLCQTISEIPVADYYFGEYIIATDSDRMSSINQRVFDRDILLNAPLVSLLCKATEPELEVRYLPDSIVFSSSTYTVFCNRLNDITKYPNVLSFLGDDIVFKGECNVSKKTLLACLDRLSLFSVATNKDGVRLIHLSFTDDNIVLNSPNVAGVETVPYTYDVTNSPYECDLNIDNFIAQIKSFGLDTIKIMYNNDSVIKMMQEDVTQILCLTINA